VETCRKCQRLKDPWLSRRGKSSRRLGGDQERRIERVYGPRKVGEYGDPVDLIGATFKWQSKSTRSLPPKYLVAIDGIAPVPDPAPDWITAPIHAMYGYRDDLVPLLIESYVKPGVRARDWLIVPTFPWERLHGCYPDFCRYVVMTGAYFLDVHGKDEETP